MIDSHTIGYAKTSSHPQSQTEPNLQNYPNQP